MGAPGKINRVGRLFGSLCCRRLPAVAVVPVATDGPEGAKKSAGWKLFPVGGVESSGGAPAPGEAGVQPFLPGRQPRVSGWRVAGERLGSVPLIGCPPTGWPAVGVRVTGVLVTGKRLTGGCDTGGRMTIGSVAGGSAGEPLIGRVETSGTCAGGKLPGRRIGNGRPTTGIARSGGV
jgi:hypothetical protein